jgi:stearoyl-CoA desaturase (Delta-9 desaturase)
MVFIPWSSAVIVGVMTGLGVTAGAHRLWAHGAYKANTILKVFLVMCQTVAFQNSVIEWVRDHRVHHKFTDTNADPHNASRGFFFSHIGWLMCKKHPDVKKFGAKVSIADLESDALLAFQHKYFLVLMPIFCFFLPTLIPCYFWNETMYNSFSMQIARYVIV